MSNKKVIIVKLGGSIVTAKNRSRATIRRAHILALGRIIKKHYRPALHSLVIVHGAGSFGHLHAAKHNLALGTKDHPEKTFAALENQILDQYLNTEIATLLHSVGLPITPLATHALVTNQGGVLKTLSLDTLQVALKKDAIPLLYGDMVFDTAWGLSISSGDVLVAKLAETLSAKEVFFASDVDGIFSQDPHQHHDAVLIEETSLSKIRSGVISLGESHNIDVTGGLSKKFSAFQNLSHLKSIYFFNGLYVENFSYIFDQKNFFGTTIDI